MTETLPCLILAGGLGTRMRPATDFVPKVLLPVAGRPFVHWQLSWLAAQGVDRVIYSVGHLGGQVKTAVGNGDAWGLCVEFVDDGPQLLGTGGAVRRAVDVASLSRFFVIYGDSYLRVSLSDVAAAFCATGWPALMTVLRNHGRWDTSNADYERGVVVRYEKGPKADPTTMSYIDYGLLAFEASVITDRIEHGATADLADVCADLSRCGLLGGFEVTERFYEIGSARGLSELAGFLGAGAPPGAPLGGRAR